MSRTQGILTLAANFEPQAAAPLDARHLVTSQATLTDTAQWEAPDNVVYAYQGMRVTVVGDPVPANNGVYWLKAPDYTNISNWEQLGTGTGGGGQIYVQPTTPVGATEGNLWYKTDTEDLFVYREISPGVFNWVAISMGEGDSDVIDGGNY